MANVPLTGKYAGWGQTEANADYKALNGGQEYGASGGDYLANPDSVNKYIDQLMGQASGNRDLVLKKLDAEHKLAVGNNDAQSAQFLESVANNLESGEGRTAFDYNTGVGRENQSYGMNSGFNLDNKNLALQKLANDEQQSLRQSGTEQGNANRGTVTDLNSRGLMYGQTPVGGLNNTTSGYNPLTGLGGVAGQTAQMSNLPYQNSTNATIQNYGTGVTGENQNYQQAQQPLDFQHANNLQDLQTTARRGIIDANNTNTFGQQQANLDFNVQKNSLNNTRAGLLSQLPAMQRNLPNY